MIQTFKSSFVNGTPCQRPFQGHFLVSATHRQRVNKVMWLPLQIYKRIPQFWFFLGLLFIAAGWIMGFEFTMAFGYVAIGIASCFFGIGIFMTRLLHRQYQAAAEQTTASAD